MYTHTHIQGERERARERERECVLYRMCYLVTTRWSASVRTKP
jgi:hypothetical protein